MKTEASKAYCRGYYAGSQGWYPKGTPPLPPEMVIADLIVALQGLCNAVDGLLATIDEDDEWALDLAPSLENGFNAIESYKAWLRHQAQEKSPSNLAEASGS